MNSTPEPPDTGEMAYLHHGHARFPMRIGHARAAGPTCTCYLRLT